jgi:hypothetical protein
MNWEMLSAIGQLVAAIGVIPSLIYLAVQIREQNKERRRAGVGGTKGCPSFRPGRPSRAPCGLVELKKGRDR